MSGRTTYQRATLYDRMCRAELRYDNERTEAHRIALLVAESDYNRAVIVQCRCDAVLRQYGSR